MNIKLGDKALITTDGWFYGPDGKTYHAVFGTVKGIFNDTDTLGIKTNARSTNWYLQIGNTTIAGCQIHYMVKTDMVNFNKTNEDVWSAEAGVKNLEHYSVIYNADAA